MPLTESPTTELEAVNVMLGAIGESPVSSLDTTLILDAVVARSILREISRETQAHGWHFNTEDNYPLPVNSDGEIILADNILDVDLDTYRYAQDVVQRGRRLYDRENHTYKFDRTLYASVTVFLPFEEMPEPHRRFVTIKSARIFVDRLVGDNAHHVYTKQDEDDAKAMLMTLESDSADHNLLNDPAFRNTMRRFRNGSGF
jgi:ribosomal protein L27